MESLIQKLATLAHTGRLSVFRLLVRRYPDALAAGDIAQVLGLKANTASVYLAALQGAGLITLTPQGRSRLYALSPDGAQAVIGGLFDSCCQGRADLCPPSLRPAAQVGQKPRVLFICTGNSARSIMAEALLRHMAGDRFEAFSAGTAPRTAVNPLAIEALERAGIATEGLHPKPLTQFQGADAPAMDMVITVCDRAANEDCPTWPGHPMVAHWGLPDPSRAAGPLPFRATLDTLRARIAAFTALPAQSLDRLALQNTLNDIART